MGKVKELLLGSYCIYFGQLGGIVFEPLAVFLGGWWDVSNP